MEISAIRNCQPQKTSFKGLIQADKTTFINTDHIKGIQEKKGKINFLVSHDERVSYGGDSGYVNFVKTTTSPFYDIETKFDNMNVALRAYALAASSRSAIVDTKGNEIGRELRKFAV